MPCSDRVGKPGGSDIDGLNSSSGTPKTSKRTSSQQIPAIAGGAAGLVVLAAAAAAFIFVLRKRNTNQEIGATKESQQRRNKQDNFAGTSMAVSKGIKSGSSPKGNHGANSLSNQVEQAGVGSALPSYLSGVDISSRNAEVDTYGLNSAVPLADDEESADETGKRVSWRDGQKDGQKDGKKDGKKGNQEENEPPGLMKQVTWDSLTSWIPK